MIVSQSTSDAKGWKVGDTVTFTGYTGAVVPVRVTGVFADQQVLDPWQMARVPTRSWCPRPTGRTV